MLYTLDNGKTVLIPNSEITRNMKALEISQEEAIKLWLDDNNYTENAEQNTLDEKAKKCKINHDITKKGTKKPKTVRVSDEKKTLFASILENINRCDNVERENVCVLKENKLIQVKIGEKIFKIDIIEQRTPKKAED